MDAVADLMGMTVRQVWTVVIVGAVLVAGWYILKAVVKTTVRVLTAGCVVILIVVAALFAVFVLM